MASIRVLPSPTSTTHASTIYWTEADGGFVKIDGPTAQGYFAAGTGDGSMTWWAPSPGTWAIVLTGKTKGKKEKVLAATDVVVTW